LQGDEVRREKIDQPDAQEEPGCAQERPRASVFGKAPRPPGQERDPHQRQQEQRSFGTKVHQGKEARQAEQGARVRDAAQGRVHDDEPDDSQPGEKRQALSKFCGIFLHGRSR
jgi:hypothetical protein